MLRTLSAIALVALVTTLSTADPASAAKKKSTYRGCPSGLTFAPDLLKKISWARGVWGFPGIGYRPPKEWKCKS
jgi:hypothetical protein